MIGRKTLTLKGVTARKEATQRIVAGRYLLKGSPRPGGLASVYRALDSVDERVVAVKLFRAQNTRDGIVEESFRRETQALSDLKHSNIVEILDFGVDEDTAEHFIVMEWIDRDLDQMAALRQFNDWEQFFLLIGRPILEALAFAHTHAIVHRDIKPSNILISDDGVPKLCDFGISKIRNFLEPGTTLSQYATPPYAPPEPDDGSYTYTRDVFGFAALCVSVLGNDKPADYGALHASLERLPLKETAKLLFRRCLSVESPADRPVNAPALLASLERATPKPPRRKDGNLLLAVTNKVRDILRVDIGVTDEASIRAFVIQDLVDARVVLDDKPKSAAAMDPSQPSFRLLGDRYGYIATIAPLNPERLLLVTALELPTSQLEERRNEALEPPYGFAFDGTPATAARLNLSTLIDKLAQFAADQKVALVERRSQAIYGTWLSLLNAKAELEKKRKKAVPYERLESSGAAVRFFLPDGSNSKVLEDQDIRIDITEELQFLGTVASVTENSVLVIPSESNKVEVEELPEFGTLTTDSTRADAALDKQKAALDAVRYGRSVNPRLGHFVIDPRSVRSVPPVNVDFIQKDIDEDKQRAVETALGRPDILLIQGPPGTGKTTFITEVVLQTLRHQPDTRILLSSQTHVALDNSLERITAKSTEQVRALRIGNEDDDRIAASTRPLLLDKQLPQLKKTSIAQGRQFLEDWASRHGIDSKFVKMSMALERYASLVQRTASVVKRIEELRPILDARKREELEPERRADLDQELHDRMKERESLERDNKEAFADLRKYEDDTETLEHFKTCSAEELRDWASTYVPANSEPAAKLKELMIVHSEWETRFGRTREFKAALVASAQVVAGTCVGVMSIPGRLEIEYDLCIVDEASIATPTEVLVPMSRARRTIIVGDSKQLSPFQDPELETSGLLTKYLLTRADQRQTLFNHLADELTDSLKRRLTTQHRMVPGIGNLISSCFYEGNLVSVERELAAGLERTMPRPVVWFSTCRLKNKASRRIGTSYSNALEVEHVVGLLRRANLELTSKRAVPITVAVLTGYGVQKERLHAVIESNRRDWTAFSDIYVNVVDAFQGREADMAIFSVTRSDERGLGFLREMERINVALSRGKNFLAIIGDHLFCQSAEGKSNPLKTVLEYIERNPKDCLLKDIEP